MEKANISPCGRERTFAPTTILCAVSLMALLAGCGASRDAFLPFTPWKSNRAPEISGLSVNGKKPTTPDPTKGDLPQDPDWIEVRAGNTPAAVSCDIRDKDNDPFTVEWQGASDVASGSGGSHIATVDVSSAGTKIVHVVAKDDRNGSAITTVAIRVIAADANRPPTIDSFAVSPETVTVNSAATLLVTASDPDDAKEKLTYTFLASDGKVTIPDATKPNAATFTAPAAVPASGKALIVCLVADSKDATGSMTKSVAITLATPTPTPTPSPSPTPTP